MKITLTLTPEQVQEVVAQLVIADAPEPHRKVKKGKRAKAAKAASKPKRVVSIATQIKMVRGGLASPKTPKHLLPSMTARLEKLLAQQGQAQPQSI